MLYFFAIALCSCLSVVDARCEDPDETATKLYFSECNTDKSHTLKITNVTVHDEKDHDAYPINMRKMMILRVLSTNSGNTINKILANIDLQYYGSILWSSCGWYTVPTLGLLHGIDQCYNCPLKPGENVLQLNYDFSPYATIIKTLAGGGVYAMNIAMYDGEHRDHEIACLRVESKISK